MTGRTPFDDIREDSAVILRIVQGPFTMPPCDVGVSQLEDMLKKCWQPLPDRRARIAGCLREIEDVAAEILQRPRE